MFSTFLRWLRQQTRRIHVRVILVAVLALMALGVATVIGPLIPAGLAGLVGAEAVDAILPVLASSMLAVVTFSLTIMVTGFSRAEGQWSPRSHRLLQEDKTTHSVLATFLGAFLYALLAMILRAADLFGERELVVLFITTVGVALWIVVTIIRWIIHLDSYGSLGYTADLLEARARIALEEMARRPAQGARVMAEGSTPPKGGVTVVATRAGYVTQVFEGALQDSAAFLGAEIFVVQPVGAFVQPGEVLARVIGGQSASEEVLAAIRAAIPVGPARTFEMDPIHAVATLAEVATRALSPGVNDPNTAVDVTYRLARVMGALALEPEDSPRCERVWMMPVDRSRLFEVGFGAVARYAGGALEVHLALQDALGSLGRLGNARLADAARKAAADHARRAMAEMEDETDRARLEAACLSPVSGS
ncbi:DUF2254 domain-containing protein [Roseicyclus marinus]|uniref:DUF2254 domain-containing protein n=1 Tax=Roseicyclus marinus TaxID=2161673 RepID=UPI00241052B2|nr:DUF2254 domain-containing protein [Roseicyclus marinus]MDG3040175.1 DUF2254 domain-containing protein [Roseicyclus marinus]